MGKNEGDSIGMVELLETLSDTVENTTQLGDEEEIRQYYCNLAEQVDGIVQKIADGTDCSYLDLFFAAKKKNKRESDVLQSIQNTIESLKHYEISLTDDTSVLLEKINENADKWRKERFSSGSRATRQKSEKPKRFESEKKTQADLLALLVEAEKNLKDATQKNNDVLSNVLTVLGIFVAIIIAIVAVYLNDVADINSLTKMASGLTLSQLLLLSSLRWHITFLLIFFLIFLIGQLTGRSLSSKCTDYRRQTTEGQEKSECNCLTCKKKKNCGKWKRLWRKYPWFMWLNVVLLLAELVLVPVFVRWFS